jgi:hypothetical protein
MRTCASAARSSAERCGWRRTRHENFRISRWRTCFNSSISTPSGDRPSTSERRCDRSLAASTSTHRCRASSSRSRATLPPVAGLDVRRVAVVTFDSWNVFVHRGTATRTRRRDQAIAATRRTTRRRPVSPRSYLIRQPGSWLSALRGAVAASMGRVRPQTNGVDRRGLAPGVDPVVRVIQRARARSPYPSMRRSRPLRPATRNPTEIRPKRRPLAPRRRRA